MDDTNSLQAIYTISGDSKAAFEIKYLDKRCRPMLNAIKPNVVY